MKPGDQRTVTETNFLIKTLKNESYFMKIREKSEKDVFHKLFYEARHMFYPKMKIIYRNGDLTKKALLVIEGEIWVMKLKKDKSEPVVIENLSQTLQKSTDFLKSKEYIMKNFPDFQVIEVLKEGGNVGLQCLFNEKDEFM